MDDTLTINLFGVADDSIVDGPGVRLAIFAQGCNHRCVGCHNPAAQPIKSDSSIVLTVKELVDKVRANPLLAGLTLTGGEPFDQARALVELARTVREDLGLSVWAYSGYLYEDLLAGIPSEYASKLLLQVDVLVDGPYVENERSMDLRWRGSANQRVIDVPASLTAGKVLEWQI